MSQELQERLAELDLEIQRAESEVELRIAERRRNPKSDSLQEYVRQARARRQALIEERAEIADDYQAWLAHERSEGRVKARAHARKTMQAAVDSAEHRVKIAQTLDRAAAAFLDALDEMNTFGNACRNAVLEAAKTAVPFNGDERLIRQRQYLIEGAGPHAGGFTGPHMKFALVVFIAKLLQRVENPQGVAQIAPGWQYSTATEMSFAEAAQEAAAQLAHTAPRIEYCLKEPHELDSRA